MSFCQQQVQAVNNGFLPSSLTVNQARPSKAQVMELAKPTRTRMENTKAC
jgi:hypothetical protein